MLPTLSTVWYKELEEWLDQQSWSHHNPTRKPGLVTPRGSAGTKDSGVPHVDLFPKRINIQMPRTQGTRVLLIVGTQQCRIAGSGDMGIWAGDHMETVPSLFPHYLPPSRTVVLCN